MNPNGKGNDKAEPKNSSKGDQAKAKDGDPKGGQGSPKSNGEPKGGDPKGDPKGGQGSAKGGGEPKGGDPMSGGDPMGGGDPKGGGDKNDPQSQAKKQIQDATHYMKKAADQIAKKDPNKAVDDQDKAARRTRQSQEKA